MLYITLKHISSEIICFIRNFVMGTVIIWNLQKPTNETEHVIVSI